MNTTNNRKRSRKTFEDESKLRIAFDFDYEPPTKKFKTTAAITEEQIIVSGYIREDKSVSKIKTGIAIDVQNTIAKFITYTPEFLLQEKHVNEVESHVVNCSKYSFNKGENCTAVWQLKLRLPNKMISKVRIGLTNDTHFVNTLNGNSYSFVHTWYADSSPPWFFGHSFTADEELEATVEYDNRTGYAVFRAWKLFNSKITRLIEMSGEYSIRNKDNIQFFYDATDNRIEVTDFTVTFH